MQLYRLMGILVLLLRQERLTIPQLAERFEVSVRTIARDVDRLAEAGIVPACRALIAPIELATDRRAYFVGKPNPLMMRAGLRMLGVHSENAVMIGDRMDTDIIAGIESGLDTVLVLSGVSTRETCEEYPYRPDFILKGVGEVPAN